MDTSAQSNMKNKSRLELLQTREQLLDEVFEAASGKITAIQKGKGKYKDLLKNLVLQVRHDSIQFHTRYFGLTLRTQALYTLMEPEVTLVCRKADEKAIKDMKDEVVKTFNEKVKFDLTLEVITELSDNSSVISRLRGHPKVDGADVLGMQRWRCHLGWLQQPNCGRQHPRRAFETAPVQHASRDQNVALWQEPQPGLLVSVVLQHQWS